MVLLREIDPTTAQLLAERIRCAIEQSTICHGTTTFLATVSIGVSIIAESDRDVQDLIERADQGLYVAKKTGRNRTLLMPVPSDRNARAA